MKILVVHAWMRGNLGDVLQLSVLMSALRELRPATLDLAGHPAAPAAATKEVVGLADRYLHDPFIWYWKFVPAPAASVLIDPWWTRTRRALFRRYDAVVCAPGPYLADYDARAPAALADIRIARDAGLPVILSSHSIGPLGAGDLAIVGRATTRVSREPATHQYLAEHAVKSTQAADLAFLYPYRAVDTAAPDGSLPRPPYRVVFLRSNNLRAAALRIDNGALFEGTTLVADASPDPIVLATSDYGRDARFLARAARRLGVRGVACRTIAELVQLVAASSGVVSDRYHPAICAASLGRPARVIANREPHKMHGLGSLLAGRALEELQALARTGLEQVVDALRTGGDPERVAPRAHGAAAGDPEGIVPCEPPDASPRHD